MKEYDITKGFTYMYFEGERSGSGRRNSPKVQGSWFMVQGSRFKVRVPELSNPEPEP